MFSGERAFMSLSKTSKDFLPTSKMSLRPLIFGPIISKISSGSLHLKCNFLLLADVFEKCRKRCLKNYDLCPSHYLRVPALTILSMTKVELDLTSDVDIYLFFYKGMRDGVSYTCKRYSKVNNNYVIS